MCVRVTFLPPSSLHCLLFVGLFFSEKKNWGEKVIYKNEKKKKKIEKLLIVVCFFRSQTVHFL